MTITRTPSGRWYAFCWPCHYGMSQRERDKVLDWAINHAEKHQKGEQQ